VAHVGVIIRVQAKPGKRDELVQLFRKLVSGVANEEGCVTYVVHTDNNDADSIWLYEVYSDTDAIAAHTAADWTREIAVQMLPNIVTQEAYWVTSVSQ
jgi:quinol monooxygenase YgiN